jgi:2'-5' RNA ligase
MIVCLKPTNAVVRFVSEFYPEIKNPDDLHITLFFLEGNRKKEEAISAVIEGIQNYEEMVHYEISSLGRFYGVAKKDDNGVAQPPTDAVFGPVTGSSVVRLREKIAKILDRESIEYSKKFEFKPHMTYAYVPRGEDYPFFPLNVSLDVHDVQIWDDSQRTVIPIDYQSQAQVV